MVAAGIRRHRRWMLAVTLAATGLFAAIYHPIGTAMLVEAAGDRPGRAIGINGVFGNLGVALAPVVTALLAQPGRLALRPSCVPGAGLRRARPVVDALPAPEATAKAAGRGAFPDIPRHLVRRAVVVLLLIAVVSGLVFNAFTLLLPKLMEERLGGDPRPAAAGRAGGVPRDAVRRADPVHRRPDDRPARR